MKSKLLKLTMAVFTAFAINAQAQKLVMDCLWADTEFAWDEMYATNLGVNCDILDLSQAKYAEETLDTIVEWCEGHKNALVVLDSIGGLLPREVAEKSAEGRTMGSQAKLVSVFCRKIIPILAENNIALVVLNHVFIDLMSGAIKTSGGEKLAYHKSQEIRLTKANKVVKQGEKIVGKIIVAKMIKNKLAPTESQETELTLIFGNGFSGESDLLADALDKGIITKSGNTFFFKKQKLGVGLGKAREALKDETLAEKVKSLL